MTSLLRRYATFEAHQRPTVGDTKTSVVAVDHLGWLICDGRSLNVRDWRILFSIIGYSFGGSGATFNLPAPAGRVMGIAGLGSGLTARTIGDISGTETHTLTINEMPSHNHAITDPVHTHTGTTSVNGAHTHTQTTVNDDFNNSGSYPNFTRPSYAQYDSAGTVTWTNTINSNGDHTHTFTTDSSTTGITTQNTGGGVAYNNMQPTLFLGNLFIYSGIPTYGTWPVTTLSAQFDPLVQ